MSTKAQEIAKTQARKPPVFVCGFPRSGTTLLYHMLLSSGGFAYYRTESWVYDILVPKFGNLSSMRNKQRLMELWLRSDNYRLSGLDAGAITTRVMSECRHGGDFLEIVMGSIAENQHVDRWAESTPMHILYLPEIKRTLPTALVIHIIRDGRDAALSYSKTGWSHALPWVKHKSLLMSCLYWEWMIRKGRSYRQLIGPNYMEVRFEELINNPEETLARIGGFIDHDLDYSHIFEVGIGSVKKPNTSFKEGSREDTFNPVGRWKKSLSRDEVAMVERLIGPFLEELGYEVSKPAQDIRGSLDARTFRGLYFAYFELKHWLKTRTRLGRFLVNTDLFVRPLDPV
jgi:hypothetical protein